MQVVECEGCAPVGKNTMHNPHEGEEQTCRRKIGKECYTK